METTQVIVFGDDHESVTEATSGIRTLAEKKGVEYRGPHPLPQIDLREKDVTLADDVELLGEAPTEREQAQLADSNIFSRSFQFHRYASDDVVTDIVKRDYPDGIFLRVKVEQHSFIGADHGNAPFTYDPEMEYNSEL